MLNSHSHHYPFLFFYCFCLVFVVFMTSITTRTMEVPSFSSSSSSSSTKAMAIMASTVQQKQQQQTTTSVAVAIGSTTDNNQDHDNDNDDDNHTTNIVRLVVISDTHGHHELLNEYLILPSSSTSTKEDNRILIHTGDFANKGSISDVRNFVTWLHTIKHMYSEVLIIDGNHDRDLRNPTAINLVELFTCDDNNNKDNNNNIHFLQDELHVTKQHGLKVFGASWQTCENDSFPKRDDVSAHSQIDVVLAHINPYIRTKDFLQQQQRRSNNTTTSSRNSSIKGWKGRKGLSNFVYEHHAPICLTGHLHWNRGYITVKVEHNNNNNNKDDHSKKKKSTTTSSGDDGDSSTTTTTYVNSASLWPGMHSGVGAVGVSPPVIIDYDIQQRKVIRIDCEPHPV